MQNTLPSGGERRSGGLPRRPEIQALRAIAVSGVVLYHLWPAAIRGGFVGVDVFFVISGFLITSQLVREATATERISLTQFWARRIRRILPAAITVLLACIALVTAVMPRVIWQTNLADIKAAAGYYVNWQLAAHAVDYLAASNSPTVVQHYWSLAVEEQFYITWPLLILATVWLVRRVRGARLTAWLVLVLGLICVASFVVSVVWTQRQPATAFFATPARAWEFALGGLVAIPPAMGGARHSASTLALLSWTGFVIVVCSMLTLSRHDAFPGAIALLPVGGATIAVMADLHRAASWSAIRVLRTHPVQWVGDNSYAIYLWHWPLIIVAPWITHSELRWPTKVLILSASLLLAAVSKTLIEDPVRSRRFWRSRRWPAYMLATWGLVAVIGLSAMFTNDVERSQHRAELAAQIASAQLVSQPDARSCFGAAAMVAANDCKRPFARPKNLDTAFAANDGNHDPCLQSNYASPAPLLCTFGDTTRPQQVIAVVGNSHAWRLIPALKLYAQRHHWEIIEISRINCLGLITTATGPDGASSSCLSWGAQVEHRLLQMHKLTGVIFASYRFWQEFTAGPSPTSTEVAATKRQIKAMWRRYRHRHVRVFVVQDVPGMRPTLDPECIQQSRAKYDPCTVPAKRVVRSTLMTRVARRDPALATYVPIDQYFCGSVKCHGLIGGVVVYFDQQHMTSTFARSMALYLGDAINRDFTIGAPVGHPSVAPDNATAAPSATPSASGGSDRPAVSGSN